MRDRYIKAKDDLIFSQNEEGAIEVITENGSEYTIGADIYRVLSVLDGETDPYSVCANGCLTRDDVDEILVKLEDNNLVVEPFFFLEGNEMMPFVHFHKAPQKRLGYRLWDWVLVVSFFPLMVTGACFFLRCNPGENGSNIIFTLLCLTIALGGHELGHALACLSCPGGRVRQAGVRLTMYCIPVFFTDNLLREAPSRRKMLHFWAAGIETNLMLFGILAIAAFFSNSDYLHNMAFANACIGGVSLMITPFTDGGRIVSVLLGSDAYANAGQILKTKDAVKRLLHQHGGLIELLSCVILYAIQLVVFVCVITFLVLGVYHA